MINTMIFLGDTVRFELTAREEDGSIKDLSSATLKTFTFQRPDMTTFVRDVDFVTDGADGKLYYLTVEGELDQEKRWEIQVYVEHDGLKLHSSTKQFYVNKPLGT